MTSSYRSGLVAIVGRPNVGKSTLLNALIGSKISIVSRRPQTTRHRILGILTTTDCQIAFVDTPGFQTEHGGPLNRMMNRQVTDSLAGTDAILLLIEAGKLTPQDRRVIALLPAKIPTVLGLSKIDRVRNRESLLSFIDQLRVLHPFDEIVPFTARRADSVKYLAGTVARHLPEGEPLYDADSITDRPERFLAAEMIREKLFHALGEEVPYDATVMIDRFEQEDGLRRIFASIIVGRDSHKAIVIGAKGARLKSIATKSRHDMERLFGGKVYLEIWVRVKRGWSDDARSLRALGYE